MYCSLLGDILLITVRTHSIASKFRRAFLFHKRFIFCQILLMIAFQVNFVAILHYIIFVEWILLRCDFRYFIFFFWSTLADISARIVQCQTFSRHLKDAHTYGDCEHCLNWRNRVKKNGNSFSECGPARRTKLNVMFFNYNGALHCLEWNWLKMKSQICKIKYLFEANANIQIQRIMSIEWLHKYNVKFEYELFCVWPPNNWRSRQRFQQNTIFVKVNVRQFFSSFKLFFPWK